MPSASFNKYQCFAGIDLPNKVHDLLGTAGADADTLKVMLSNIAPNAATHTVRADVGELSTANGYTSGGQSIANVGTNSSGTITVAGSDVTWTASGGSIGPFQYVILYNDTAAGDPLIGWWDYGSPLTLTIGQALTVGIGASGVLDLS